MQPTDPLSAAPLPGKLPSKSPASGSISQSQTAPNMNTNKAPEQTVEPAGSEAAFGEEQTASLAVAFQALCFKARTLEALESHLVQTANLMDEEAKRSEEEANKAEQEVRRLYRRAEEARNRADEARRRAVDARIASNLTHKARVCISEACARVSEARTCLDEARSLLPKAFTDCYSPVSKHQLLKNMAHHLWWKLLQILTVCRANWKKRRMVRSLNARHRRNLPTRRVTM
ncbi:hypothetical protein QBC43DRAFT_320441 [Cladorrhinum sp. PSN259]|nr:hypothetical protein QBC43DRAFT_320441 [Cladorrhinum sp. PSN259]